MGIQFPESPRDMKFLLLAALCASALSLPQGRKLRTEEHWRPSQARDLSKYKPRHPQVAAGSFDIEMEKINKVAAEMRASGKTNKKDRGQPRAECGIEGPKAKIVGGEEATPHTWPWQVALFIDNAWFCGGSIISENYVLTAAYCADGASYFEVLAGAHNVREDEDDRIEITSYNGWTHPSWDSWTLQNDLALIELPQPVPMNDIISTSCLPNKGDVIAVGLTTVTGWGLPSDNAGGISEVLREVRDIPVMDSHLVTIIMVSSVMASSVSTPLEDVAPAMETPVVPWSRRLVRKVQDKNGTRSESSPLDLSKGVSLVVLMDSQGLNTTLTGLTVRLAANKKDIVPTIFKTFISIRHAL